MDKENLKELKQRFNELFKAGDLAAAGEVAEEIMRAFPESASGYYYALVAETKNFRVRGDEKKTEELYARFCERAEKPLAEKYGEKLAALNAAETKTAPAKAEKKAAGAPAAKGAEAVSPKGKFSLTGLLLGILCVLFAAACVLSWGTFRTFSEPYSSYQTGLWDLDGESYYDSVVYHLTLNKDDSENAVVVDSVWLNLGGTDRNTDSSTASVTLSSAQGSTSTFSTGFGGGAKTVPNVDSSVGSWIKLASMTSTSTSRTYYMLSTKNELRYNEVVFLDKNGKKIEAEIYLAGPNENPAAALGDLIRSAEYEGRKAEAAATLDEQAKFDVSAVGENGVYASENYTGKLTEREIVTLDSALNILSGESGFTDDTANALGLELIAAGVAIFGANSFGLRIVPMLFTLGTLILIYFFAKNLFSSRWAGLAASLLYAVGGYALSGATLGTVDAIFVFFCLLSAFFMALFYRKVAKQNASSYLSLALSGAAYALAVSVKTHAIFLLAGLIVVFAFALYKQHKTAKTRRLSAESEEDKRAIAYAEERSRNLYIVIFLSAFVLAAAVWTALCFLFAYGAYFGATGISAGSFITRVLGAPFREAATQYSAHNATDILGWLIGFQAEKLSASKYFFGNTVLSVLSLFSFIYCTVYVIFAYASRGGESRSKAFKKNVFTPYLVLASCFLSTWVFYAFNAQAVASGFALGSLFYDMFPLLAVRLLVSQEKKTVSIGGEKAGISTAVFAAIVLFAAVLGICAYAKYAGIALDFYPLDFASIRW